MDVALTLVVATLVGVAIWAWWRMGQSTPAQAEPAPAPESASDVPRRARARRLEYNTETREALGAVPGFQFEDLDELDITKVSVMTEEEEPDAGVRPEREPRPESEEAPESGPDPEAEAEGPEAETLRIDGDERQPTRRMRRRREDPTTPFERGVVPIIYDDDASIDQPTAVHAYLLLSAVGQSDTGKRRSRNEDYFAVVEDPPLYIVADGMGGHAGGALASAMAVETIVAAYKKSDFDTELYDGLPRRGRELVQAIQLANRRIHDKGVAKEELAGMGTTVVCARFSPRTERVYIGHVGDSRCYRVRNAELHQLTSDHNVAAQGFKGPIGSRLTRALGHRPSVVVDLMVGRPKPGDRYLLCSDGLSKMVDDDTIRDQIIAHDDPEEAVAKLIALANDAGGKDNTTAIAIYVEPVTARMSPRDGVSS